MSKEDSTVCTRSRGDRVTEGNLTVEDNLYVNGNAQVDGKVDIGGNVHVGKSLKVDGFLDAPNIRGCSKGLFVSRDSLVAKYPRPHLGWWAVVCAELSSGSSEATLFTCLLDEYDRPYWADTGATVSLAGLLDQFEQFDAAVERIDAALSSLSDDIDVLQTDMSSLQSAVGVIDGVLDTLRAELTMTEGTLTTVQGDVSSLQGDVSSLQSAVATLEAEAIPLSRLEEDEAAIGTLQEEVSAVDALLSDYSERREHWDGVTAQLESGRVNNGTERFDGVYDSTAVTCTFFDEAPDGGTDWDGVVWLCDKKMFVAYKAAAVTNSTCSDVVAVWFFFYHWSTDYLYMEEVATEGKLWRDKVYMAEGHLWMWKRCSAQLEVAGAAGDYEVLTNEEIDEILDGFQFIDPSVIGGLSSIVVAAAAPLEAAVSVDDDKVATLTLNITEATETEIDNIFDKED